MKKFVLLILIIFAFTIQSFSFADEIKPVDDVVVSQDDVSQDDEVEVLQGFVEYYPDGTVFFDRMNDTEGVFLNIKNPMSYNQYSVKDIKGINYEDIKNRQVGVKQHFAHELRVDNFFTTYAEKHGGFSYGTSYGADIDIGQYEYTTKFFARYDTKHFGIQAAYSKDSYLSTGGQADYISLTPEIKLGKGFVLMDTIKTNTLRTRNDNTITLKYTPQFIKEKPLDLGVGVGQTFYQDGSQKNVVKFETTLRL